jgi:hypothetical protein
MTETAPATLKLRMAPQLRTTLEQLAQESGNSLNTEIVKRLQYTLASDEIRHLLRETTTSINNSLAALHRLHREVLELARKMEQDEHKNIAIKIALDLAPVQEALFAAATEASKVSPPVRVVSR